jgi:hypothetical protein
MPGAAGSCPHLPPNASFKRHSGLSTNGAGAAGRAHDLLRMLEPSIAVAVAQNIRAPLVDMGAHRMQGRKFVGADLGSRSSCGSARLSKRRRCRASRTSDRANMACPVQVGATSRRCCCKHPPGAGASMRQSTCRTPQRSGLGGLHRRGLSAAARRRPTLGRGAGAGRTASGAGRRAGGELVAWGLAARAGEILAVGSERGRPAA